MGCDNFSVFVRNRFAVFVRNGNIHRNILINNGGSLFAVCVGIFKNLCFGNNRYGLAVGICNWYAVFIGNYYGSKGCSVILTVSVFKNNRKYNGNYRYRNNNGYENQHFFVGSLFAPIGFGCFFFGHHRGRCGNFQFACFVYFFIFVHYNNLQRF